MAYTSKNIRNVVVLGHQGSGKTTLVESLAYITHAIDTKGSVEKKNTISDYLVEEQARLSSVSSAIVPVVYKNYKINLIDLPGNDDFIMEALSVTRIVKGAVLVIDASKGVEVGTVKHYNLLKKRGIPTIIYVNKMDKEEIVFENVLNEIREKIGKNAVPFCYPMGHNENFDGFVNVVDLKARKFNGTECEDCEIYDDKKLKVFELHNMLCESVAETSEELLNKFFNGEELTREEIHSGLRKGVLEGQLLPVLVGSANKNIGLHTMLDMFIDYLPNPADLKAYEGTDENQKSVSRKTVSEEPFSAYVFKTICDPYAGVINIFKVNSGSLSVGDEIYDAETKQKQKVSTLFTLFGKKQVPVNTVEAGDIAAVSKLDGIETAHTLSTFSSPIMYKKVNYPTAVYFKAIVPKNKADEDKLSTVLQKIKLEDPTLEIRRNVETHQLLLGGLGASHLSYVLEKMKNIYKVDLATEEQKIVYRETIKSSSTAGGRYVKQSGGSGFFGVVEMRFEPASENTFAEEVFGGAVPKNYFPAVEKGFNEACEKGLLAGFPVIGVKAVLVDGKYHPVDSNELAFKMAAILAFKEAYPKCSPTILEPVYKVAIRVNNDYIGDILSDLNTRRGKVQSMGEVDGGLQEIVALVPEAELISYANDLKALTQSSGFFNREFNSYEEVPKNLIDKIIKENSLL